VKASEIAALVQGRLQGGADPDITGVAPLDRAGPSDLSLLAHARYAVYLGGTRAGAVLVSESLAGRHGADLPAIVVKDVHGALARVLSRLYPEPATAPGVHPSAVLESGVELGPDVAIGPYAVIGAGTRVGARVRIGAHCAIAEACVLAPDVTLAPHVTLYRGVRIGERTTVHSGTRLGVDGFGYVWDGSSHRKVPQVGGCVIGADVEIGANVTIDRGSIGATEIGDGVKIDNLVQIGHNVRVGPHTIIIAQVGIAGSSTIGAGVTLAGQVGVGGHVTIGDRATVGGQAGVFGDLAGGETYSGHPARPHRETMRAQAAVSRLPRIMQRLRALERALFGEERKDG
jgi:UDP-3-O-[3-hydroxymyristoyl] glucosamine N-acyltransferase